VGRACVRFTRFTDIMDGTSTTLLLTEVAGRPRVWQAGKAGPGRPRVWQAGKAGRDMLGHGEKLTYCLHQAGHPLDNNLCDGWPLGCRQQTCQCV
jgi:hypothetical protein